MISSLGRGKYLSIKGFEHCSSCERLINARRQWHRLYAEGSSETTETLEMKTFVVELVVQSEQREVFAEEIGCLLCGRGISNSSHIVSLDSYLDDNGMLRVGGRLRHADLNVIEKILFCFRVNTISQSYWQGITIVK